jgi:hypothetical protein
MRFNLARLLADNGDVAAARPLAQAALDWRDAHQPEQHPQRIASRAQVAWLDCVAAGQQAEALDAAPASLSATPATRQREVLLAYAGAWQAQCHHRLGRPEAAAELDQARAVLTTTIGERSCGVAALDRLRAGGAGSPR